MNNEGVIECPKCEGCGQIADNDDMTPWIHRWKGLLGPFLCPQCGGKGMIFADELIEEDRDTI